MRGWGTEKLGCWMKNMDKNLENKVAESDKNSGRNEDSEPWINEGGATGITRQ